MADQIHHQNEVPHVEYSACAYVVFFLPFKHIAHHIYFISLVDFAHSWIQTQIESEKHTNTMKLDYFETMENILISSWIAHKCNIQNNVHAKFVKTLQIFFNTTQHTLIWTSFYLSLLLLFWLWIFAFFSSSISIFSILFGM